MLRDMDKEFRNKVAALVQREGKAQATERLSTQGGMDKNLAERFVNAVSTAMGIKEEENA
jgi:hypothetical protein